MGCHSNTLLVWDGEGTAPDGEWSVALWRAFPESGRDAYCIPSLLERRADALRARYLAWIQDLGDTLVDGVSIRDHLALRPGFSFWWMTLLAEKSNAFHSLQIIGAIKALALEELLEEQRPERIVLVTHDRALIRALAAWCAATGTRFESRAATAAPPRMSRAKRCYLALPHLAQAIATLGEHVRQRFRLRGAGVSELRSSAASLTICSYLFNLDKSAAAAGNFGSAFWSVLHGALRAANAPVNWLLMFIPHEFVPDAARARELIERFNSQGNSRQAHATLDGVLGPRLLWRSLRDFWKVTRAARRLRGARRAFAVAGSKLDLWPYFERDWHSSLRGSAAMSNCIYMNLIETTLRMLPHQKIGCYLQENIAWELAFVHFWKASGHGTLVGVPHSTVRFWDLRYFFDPRAYARDGSHALPLPDIVALNGPAALDAYREGGYPPERIVEVEALRYLHLLRLPKQRPQRPSQAGGLRVLVLGDYMEVVTAQQMEWLVRAASALPAQTRYVVKPHPACPIDRARYPSIQFDVRTDSLDQLLVDCDVAYTSNMTSAAVDAYSAGVPVVSVLSADAFNISPLRGLPGVTFVENPAQLAHALVGAGHFDATGAKDFFYLDEGLPRWRRLLRFQETA